ncbi:MAG: hypothetical protein WBH19_07295 [Candidatus Nanopelagicales bacterium]
MSHVVEKACTKRGEVKPLEAFPRHKTTRDGFRPECRDCQREYNRAYRESNGEQLREAAAERHRANPGVLHAFVTQN